ncbi:MAG: Gfo/Idh/MocA family oxidoreductase [Proteobacteria bacterium]|nr:Gfo/Idh/MocA family oxidoreductase [Pseudomonadota bacterium]
MTARLTAALCGLGNISWRFGKDAEGDALCHAEAMLQHPGVRLAGGCDPDSSFRAEFTAHHGLRTFEGLAEMLGALNPHIVSICSPAALHLEHAQRCIEHGVPMIWLEKPPAGDCSQLRLLLDQQKAQGGRSTVLVNYQRRYTPCFVNLRDALRRQTMGRLVRIDVNYSRGLETNGSHLLDQVFFLLGEDLGYTLDWVSGASSANPCCGLTTAQGVRIVIQGDELPYHNIDIRATCEGGRLSILHGGMTTEVERIREHECYPGFYRLAQEDASLLGPGGQLGAFSTALEDLIEAHRSGRQPISSLRSALSGQVLMERILPEARS